MLSNQITNTRANTPTRQFTSVVTRLKPNEERYVPLGSYSNSDPDPTFELSFAPDTTDLISSSLEKEAISGTSRYVMFYKLRNTGAKPCEATIRRAAS